MKKIKRIPLLLSGLIFALLAAACIFAGSNSTKAYAATSSSYDLFFTSYNVKYDVRKDRTMDVELDLTVHYTGWNCHGFIYDIPVNAGDRVRNLKAYKLDANGNEGHLEYTIENDDSNLVSVYMDDDTLKTGQTISYIIRYEYAITKPTEKNKLELNAIGFGSDFSIYDANVEINLPDGLAENGVQLHLDYDSDVESDDYTRTGNKVVYSAEYLSSGQGATFVFEFTDGVLGTKADMTPYWIIIIACGVLAVLFAVKFLLFNKNDITPIPCFSVPVTPPEGNGAPSAAYDDPTMEMDPLQMGKLIDNKVDNSDVTSLIYYWANKGYIKINTENEKDIVLIRIYQTLPQGTPNYQNVMYNGMFKGGDSVHINSLSEKFYPTVEKVTKEVNSEAGKLYDGKSMAVAIIFALIGALAMCITPIMMAFIGINSGMLLIIPLFMVVPAFIIFALTQSVKYRALKYKKSKIILLYCAIGALAVVFSLIYMLIVPSYVMENLPKFLLAAISFAIVMISVSIISRTEYYTTKLNRIIGFKEFIDTVEKEKLETMLESNPELYYNVLPYAIVLGVSDKWQHKFDGLTVQPPQWASGNITSTVFNIMLFNAIIRNMNVNLVKAFVSRPSSRSFSGGHGGFGGFGGFGGGGHGGGGFRGR